MKRMKRVVLPLILGLLLTLGISELASWATPENTPQTVNTGQHFLPPYGNPRERFGFDSGRLTGYDVAQLHAGWYSNWGASVDPPHPDQLVYVQLIRFHAGADRHDPSQVTVKPGKTTIARIAAAHPGSLWLMSNEPDSLYQGDPILPEVYAVVYHDLYEYIKGLDPGALIANGGIVQPTPCRLEYLDIVLDTYEATYGELMPVDVWNIHAFVLREVYNSWGASTPPGVDPSCGIDYTVDQGGDIDIFWNNIKAMRTWMKERGYQDKPLIISEYGILWPEWFAPQFTPQRVSQFMVQTFDLFLNEKDPEIGYPADDGRLVQAWAWYSLSDDQYYNGYLFRSGSKNLSPMGEAYANYTGGLSDVYQADLTAQLVAAWPSFTSTSRYSGTTDLVTFTVALTGNIANLGKLPATDALARLEIISGEDGSAIFGSDAYYTVPARFTAGPGSTAGGVIVLPPLTATLARQGHHELRLSLDPEEQIDESREWNNVVSTTLDLRPDLVPVDLAYRLTGPAAQSGTLVITAAVRNQGSWPSPAVSATVYLKSLQGTLDVPAKWTVPYLETGEWFSTNLSLTWPGAEEDLYRLVLDIDEADRLSEQDEANNQTQVVVPVVVTATLMPTRTTVLTSVSGAVQLAFPAGIVTAPTQATYTPLWPANWVQEALEPSSVGFALATERDLMSDHPFSVTWRYREVDVADLDVDRLRLFVLNESDTWHDAACQGYQRVPDQNRLTAVVCRVGQFVFGNRYDLYLPLLTNQGSAVSLSNKEVPAAPWRRSPLRLP